PHGRISPVAPSDPRDRRPERRGVSGLLGPRGDLPRPRARALPGGRRPPAPSAPDAARAREPCPVARGAGNRDAVPALAGLLRGAHDVGRDQRADRAHGLSPPGGTRGTPRALGAAGAHPARRVEALLLLLSAGGDPAAAPRRRPGRAPARGSLLGSGRERGPAPERASVHGRLPLRRRGGPGRSAKSR